MAAKKKESRRQRLIRDDLECNVGGFWIKIWGGPFQVAGIPDLLGCVEGRFFAFEVKEPGEQPSDVQVYIMGLIKKAGGTTMAIETSEEAIDAVRKTLSEAKSSCGFRESETVVRITFRTRHRKDVDNRGDH